MNMQGSTRTHSSTGLSRGQRWVACALLVFVVFLVVNPIFECGDRMDNVGHLGSNGFLLIALLIAWAGVLLLKSPRWISLNGLDVSLISPQFMVLHPKKCDKLPCIFGGDLLLPLRV